MPQHLQYHPLVLQFYRNVAQYPLDHNLRQLSNIAGPHQCKNCLKIETKKKK